MDGGTRILRPVPRRPVSRNLVVGLEDGQSTDGSSCLFESEAGVLSRKKSLVNLTSSTLMGIYDEVTAEGCDLDDSSWDLSPTRLQTVDDATDQLIRLRSHTPRRKFLPSSSSSSSSTTAFALTGRLALLFLLGSGYGVLVTRLHGDDRYRGHVSDGIVKPGLSCNYLACWGALGVALGSLLPWFDKVWDDSLGAETEESSGQGLGPGTDWALVMRAIGAFAGIVFAIRKLSWVSTLQISTTLALVNPLLWWLIDRSTVGLLLSAGVGVTGSALLLSVNPNMMPAPSRALQLALAGRNMSASSSIRHGMLPAATSQETVETGIWMLCVLFNSCVCFGNIGRRLARSENAGIRGRWGGLR
ncbi:hypothetical protein CDD80_2434 [Ophiocordyceps camponoti-rufipedis]|uniref:Insulin-induced protein n=1 Tax=Ophiocordyceps camponoti-rufipedis TaxID=2004952 RepID=A0A2C5ZK61_9HYPO|nr:hypothetical protein CDD80_2434 [Ophiocordyceps camponoti-rufipedis]